MEGIKVATGPGNPNRSRFHPQAATRLSLYIALVEASGRRPARHQASSLTTSRCRRANARPPPSPTLGGATTTVGRLAASSSSVDRQPRRQETGRRPPTLGRPPSSLSHLGLDLVCSSRISWIW
jgi:hypothetical protein